MENMCVWPAYTDKRKLSFGSKEGWWIFNALRAFFSLKSYPYLGSKKIIKMVGQKFTKKNYVFFFKSLLLPMKTFWLLMPIASNRSFLSLFVLKIRMPREVLLEQNENRMFIQAFQ